MRLGRESLRQLQAAVAAFVGVKRRSEDGRMIPAMTRQRIVVVQWVIQQVGWSGREVLSHAEIAAACDTTIDTVGAALHDARDKGWLEWQQQFITGPDGRRRNLPNRYSLKKPDPEVPSGLTSKVESSLSSLSASRKREAEARARRKKDANEEVEWKFTAEQLAEAAAAAAATRVWWSENRVGAG
jgi:hypothetical protein